MTSTAGRPIWRRRRLLTASRRSPTKYQRGPDRLEAALLSGTPAQQKATLRQVGYEIETDGKRVWPMYRIPGQGFGLWELWWTQTYISRTAQAGLLTPSF